MVISRADLGALPVIETIKFKHSDGTDSAEQSQGGNYYGSTAQHAGDER